MAASGRPKKKMKQMNLMESLTASKLTALKYNNNWVMPEKLLETILYAPNHTNFNLNFKNFLSWEGGTDMDRKKKVLNYFGADYDKIRECAKDIKWTKLLDATDIDQAWGHFKRALD